MAQATPAAPAKRADSISELARSEARTAFWLLAPTFTILLLLAIYPLGQVFYLSFTNARFADPGSTTEFVGWQNYRDLLSFTIRELPPELGDDGQQVVEDGVPQFERASRVLRGEGDARDFRAVREFNLGGNRYVLGAANADFIRSVGDTLFVAIIAVALEAVLGIAIALVLAAKFFGRGAMRAAMLIPWAIITVVLMVVFTPNVSRALGLELVPAAVVAAGIPLLLALSVLAHELAHGLTAQRLGIPVREYVLSLWGGHTSFHDEIARPGASARPARPATWCSNCTVRSAARRSPPARPRSASTTPTRVRCGKCQPLATICVPMMRSTSRFAIRCAASAAACGPGMVSLAITSRRASGNTAATSSVMRSTPGPIGTRVASAAQVGQAGGIGSAWPQWWQVSSLRARCSTSQAVQFGQPMRCPQARHSVSGAYPRRFRNSMACSPRARVSCTAATSGGARNRPRSGGVSRRSNAATSGSEAPPCRAASVSRR